MTPSSINIAIATELGWTQLEDYSERLMMAKGTIIKGYPPVDPIIGKKESLPDFCNDLDAMFIAEAWIIKQGKWQEYKSQLWQLFCKLPDAWEGCELCGDDILHTPAIQRATAFVKAIWKWKE